MVLKSGISRPVSHISSTLRCALLLKTPAGLNAIQITVDVELQENGRVIGRPTGSRRIHAFESELAQIKFIHKTSTTRTGLASVT